jgi:uncharacterized protein
MIAIDAHVHPSTKEKLVDHMGHYEQLIEKYFKVEVPVRSDQEFADEYRALDMKAVVLALDSETRTGYPPVTNDYVAELCRDHSDVFVGLASVDPWKRALAVQEAERSIKELGLIGVKFHPGWQGFYPHHKEFYPLWEKCQELGAPVLFHSGFMGAGSGQPGGLGFYLDHSRPIYLDFVAADFPDLTIILAHPSWPWQDEAIAICLHKANVFIDLSGWSPKYFPPQLKHEINSRLQDKVMFGSDYPYVTPQKWMEGFETLDLKPGVREKILYENARRILPLPW